MLLACYTCAQVNKTEQVLEELEYFTQKSDLLHQLDVLDNWILLHRRLGKAYRDRTKYDKAITQFQYALGGAWRRTKYKNEYLQRAWALADIGYTAKIQNKLPKVIQYYEKAAAIFRDTLGWADIHVARYIYSELGNAYSSQRDYEKAALYHQQRKTILLQENADEELTAGAYLDLGIAYNNWEKYDRAVAEFAEGLKFNTPGLSNKVDLNREKGLAHVQLGEIEAAWNNTRQAELLVRNARIPQNQKDKHLYEIFQNYGAIYSAKKQFREAEQYFSKAIQLLKNSNYTRSKALAHRARGNFFLEWNKPEPALEDFNTALACFLPEIQDSNLYSLPGEDQLSEEPTLIDLFGGMAQSYSLLDQADASRGLSEKALQCYHLAEQVETLLLNSYLLEESQLTAQDEHRWVRSGHLDQLHNRLEKHRTPELEEQLFTLSEKSRAYLLWQGMAAGDLLDTDSLQHFGTAYDQLNDQIESLEDIRNTAQDSIGKDTVALRLLKLKAEKASLVQRAAQLVPGNGLTQQRDQATLSSVQKQLKPNEALLEFFIGDKGEFVLLIAVTPKKVAINKINWNPEWSDMAATINRDICTQNNPGYIRKARALYDRLLKPTLESLPAKNLTLIPDGVLWEVPFAALLTRDIPESENGNFKNYPYLIREKQLVSGFSATLQREMCTRTRKPDGKALAFAPSYRKIGPRPSEPKLYAARRSLLDTLLYNQSEVSAITKILNIDAVYGRSASKAQFLQTLSRARFLHIAAHAKANHEDPKFSFIALSNTGDTIAEPYRVYMHELYNRRVPAELVTLSACETGTGPVRAGEGMLSIARAFANGGAQSIVTTLWSVDDKASKDIMVAFYQNLKNKWAKDRALQEAQLIYIQNAPDQDRAHPYYWAAYMVIGNPGAIQTAGPCDPLLIGMLIVGIFFLGLGWWYFRKRLSE